MANINTELFKRYAPTKKLALINSLSENELLNISYKTILRIIKEAGTPDDPKKRRCKFKTLNLKPYDAGNEWNSDINSIYNSTKDEVWMEVYVQGDDTDTTCGYKLRDFLDNRYEEQILGEIHESWDYGYSHTKPAVYDREDRARVIRAICRAYVENKYKEKLKAS